MRYFSPSPFIALTMMAAQVLGPAVLWAAEQRGIRVDANRQIIVSALSGNQLTLQGEQGTRSLQFREGVTEGAQVSTGPATTAELLIGNRAVFMLGNGTTAQVRTVSTDQTTIQVSKGMVRVAAAASALGPQGLVTVQTPTSQVQTRGGILRVAVDAPISRAEYNLQGAQAYRASYTTGLLLAAAPPSSDLIHVEEGTAEIPGVGPTGGLLTMKAGQRVTVQAGRAGGLTEAVSQGAATGILATTGHTLTPKEGRDYLVALQVDQATKLGQALTGAAQTGEKESEKKSDTKNVINGATGGVTLQTQDAFAKLFGGGGFFSGTGGTTVSNSGSGTLDDRGGDLNDDARVVGSTQLNVKGGAGLLLFTDRPDATDRISDQTGKVLGGGEKLNNFTVSKELVIVDGGDQNEAAHLGKAPVSTLVARAIVQGDSLYGGSPKGDNTSLPLSWEVGARSAEKEVEIPENARVLVIKSKTEPTNREVLNHKVAEPIIDPVTLEFIRFRIPDHDIDPETCRTSTGCAYYGTKDSILGDFSSQKGEFMGISYISQTSYVDGVISARSATTGDRLVTLAGGAVLDKQTKVSVGDTTATGTYFTDKPGLNSLGATKFTGSLLTVLASKDGGFNPAFVKVQDRLLGVIGGSLIREESEKKTALLSVLDSRVMGPDKNDPSTGTNGRKANEVAPVLEFDGSGQPNRTTTTATVTSAVVVRSTDVPLDGALLSASSPLLAMMQATLTTNSHFADLAGNNGRQSLIASLVPGDALVRLDNAALTVNGNLLNLNNATATVTGYLFSLSGSSSLNLLNPQNLNNHGSLFSLNNGSSLALTGNAFGVFGSGTNTLTIDNNLCGAGAVCGALVDSAGKAITLNGTALKVAGVSQNVVLPNNFNAFALAPDATASNAKINAKIDIDANDALFHIDPTSTLTINGTKVK